MSRNTIVQAITALIIFTGITGNVLITWTIVQAKLYRKQMYALILSLALVDLFDELLMVPPTICQLLRWNPLDIVWMKMLGFGSGWWGFLLIQAHFTDIILLTLITSIQAISLDKKGWIELHLNSRTKVGALILLSNLAPVVLGTWTLLPGIGMSRQIYNDTLEAFALEQRPEGPPSALIFILFFAVSMTCALICVAGDLVILRKIHRSRSQVEANGTATINGTSSVSTTTDQNSSRNLALQFVGVNTLYITLIGLVAAELVLPRSWRGVVSASDENKLLKWDLIVQNLVTHGIYASNFYVYFAFNQTFRQVFLSSIGCSASSTASTILGRHIARTPSNNRSETGSVVLVVPAPEFDLDVLAKCGFA